MSHNIGGNRYDTRRRNYVIKVDDTTEPASPPVKKSSAHRPDGHKMSSYTAKIFLGLICLAIIAGILVLWRYTVNRPSDPLPASLRQSVSYAIYYPTKEPAGYKFDSSSIQNSNGALSYSLTKPGSQPIVITQQATPKNFDPKAMFQHNPLPTTISPLGTIYDLSYKNQSRFMVDSTDSLIFISSGSKLSNSQLHQIITGLKQSK